MNQLRGFIISILMILFPIFFITTTQEFYTTNKFYLLGFVALILLVVTTLGLLTNKKLSWRKSPFDVPILIFLILYATSVVVSSPNKIQALLNPTTGFVVILALGVLFYILHQHEETEHTSFNPLGLLHIAASILAVVSIVFFFDPFANVELPQRLLFLKNATFSPIGTTIDLFLFLGFFVLFGGLKLYYHRKHNSHHKPSTFTLVTFALIVVAFGLSTYTIFRPVPQVQNQNGQTNESISIFQTLPPYTTSWYAAIETMKSPKTALFGVGPDNYASIFTRVKTPQYNSTPLWNVNFTQSRSFFLHLWTTTGLLGLAGFIIILFLLTRAVKKSESRFNVYYLLAAFLLFPASLPLLFLLFVMLVLTAKTDGHQSHQWHVNLAQQAPIYVGIAVISFLIIGASGYFLGRSYVAEYYFKRSLDAFPSNEAQPVYQNMLRAIQTNPYIERYRISFSQLNMLIANNIATNAQEQAANDDSETTQISEQDRQNIANGIQAAIQEAKAAVALNPNKSTNWENLAVIYRNIINVAEGAPEWTVASYERAIVTDPQNPIYRLNLGGVLYQLGSYEEAARLFEQAVNLKPDWANAYYNLAWANYQLERYERAAAIMERALAFLTDKKSNDYKRAEAELKQFREQVPPPSEATTEAGGNELNLPTPPTASIEPRIELPQSAEPPTGAPTTSPEEESDITPTRTP